MSFVMKECGPPISDNEILSLEKGLQIQLPEEYKAFLKTYNGGRPEPKFFPITGLKNNPFGQIQDFFGIDDPVESCRLDWNYRTFKGRLPTGFFPIACEDGGSLICLLIAGDEKEALYYWDFYGEACPPTYKNVYRIAETFQEFLDLITDADIASGP